ncbi:MAG: glycine cleavage system aminomethyltransferase GcvT [Anaerolineales bacterium]|nr:glycine cleavage system aminomethyltransferase GcvT [Anaerolineales bacterium]
MTDFLFRGSLADLDPEVYKLTQLESERQARKLILIASESQAPLAVRDAMGSAFQNIYAEGYPEDEWRKMSEADLFDYEMRLAEYRRNSDPRYYKGVEYADIIESLAITRARQLFAANGVKPEQIHVNVQALSGGPANNAVYQALVGLGDTILGMNLLHGGHLSHGSSVNRSGKWFNAVHYAVDPETQKIDYDNVRALALEHKPKLLIAGASSYSWVPDWKKFREIADEVGAIFLADISHLGGLVAAGVVPSPIGYAHVTMSTTHKSLDGPRGAVLLTTDLAISKKIDRAVFPGEQGGPHVHIFAALALTFKLATTAEFKQLQAQTIKNAVAMVDQFQKRGLRIPFGGTDTHLVNVDVTTIQSPEGVSLSGDMAARILDLVGIVVNRNTIPGDKSALNPSGIRLGTPWISQRGFDEAKTRQLTDIMADILLACAPHAVDTVRKGKVRRAKLDFETLNTARLQVRKLAEQAGIDFEYEKSGYPHFFYIDDAGQENASSQAVFDLRGRRARQFLDYATSADLSALKPATVTKTDIQTPRGVVSGDLTCLADGSYRLSVPAAEAGLVATWLRDLSDAYVSFRADGQPDYDPARLPGPVVVAATDAKMDAPTQSRVGTQARKPWFIGIPAAGGGESLPEFSWVEPADPALKRTSLYDLHKSLGGRMVPFAGWEMPVQYSGVKEEHLATRQAAGLFDVSHMGVYEVLGRDAVSFLDTVCGNDIGGLGVGESLYTHFLTPDADVIDDTLVYRRANAEAGGPERFLVVVNASNDDKDRAWLESVRDGAVKIDAARPSARTYGYEAVIRNLRDAAAGDAMRVDIALQGPKSRDTLFAMGVDAETKRRILALKRTELCDATVGGFDLIISRTGYTGEKMAFELFVHPQRAPEFWNAILQAGEPFGVRPIGLAARDSLRTEAGLPLYGHEMGLGSGRFGERDLGVAEGGFGSYVKTYKPWFIGREAFLAREKARKGAVIRFRFVEQGMRMAHNGDPVVDKKGKVIGWVTSCSLDSEGYLTGQAYLTQANTGEGAPIFIYQGAPKDAGVAPAEMTMKDKATLPGAAVVVSRFAKL